MIELIDIPAHNVVGMRIAGKIDKEGFDTVLAEIKKAMEASEDRIRVYVELEEFGGMEMSALVEDIKFVIPNFRRFAKKAVVSDKAWVAKLGEVGDKLFPSIDVKTFTPQERDIALRWVEE